MRTSVAGVRDARSGRRLRVSALLSSCLRNRERLHALLGYDPRGFVHVVLTNSGDLLDDVTLDLLIPSDAGPGWVARVDVEGHPQMETGSFFRDEETQFEGAASLHWREVELTLEPGETVLRFFVGVAAVADEMPVVVRVDAQPVASMEFSSTLSRTPLT